MDVILNNGYNTVYCTLSNMLVIGRTAKQRSQNKNSYKMRAYFWPWIVISLADVIKSLEF